MLADLFLITAVLGLAIVYGTDVFFAYVGRAALERSSDSAVSEVLGRIHQVADVRMPLPAAVGLISTALFTLFSGFSWAGFLGLLAFAAALAHLRIYSQVAKPINVQMTKAVQAGETLADVRGLQRRWDSVIGLRAGLLGIALLFLLLAALL